MKAHGRDSRGSSAGGKTHVRVSQITAERKKILQLFCGKAFSYKLTLNHC